jgi:hypothetical protein
MNEISIQSTSRYSATSDLIVLRQSDRIRLVCKPLIVDNPNDQGASVKLTIIYQRKSVKDTWVDYKDINLTQLRTSEGVKLELHCAEVLELYKNLTSLYKIYNQVGIPFGDHKFIDVNTGLGGLLSANEDEINHIFDSDSTDTAELIMRLFRWFSKTNSPESIISALETSDQAELQHFNSLVGLSALKNVLSIWNENSTNSNEEFWQKIIEDNSYILSQVFAYPVVVVKGKAYVGGKTVMNSGGNLVDFLLKNSISKNTILVEIKTPTTPLLGEIYRGNSFSISKHLSGAIVQVSSYKDSLQRESNSLLHDSHEDIVAFEPPCIVIIGNSGSELNTVVKKRSFELLRSHLSGINVITYDELFGKVKLLIDLLEGTLQDTMSPEEEEIPF